MTRVLIVGLDSADWNLIEGWIAAGSLPTLSRLMASGYWASLSPPPGLGNNAAWPSFFTGASPARHGRYGYRMVAPGSYQTRDFRPEDYRCEPFWLALSQAGRRVAIIDVPKAPLATNLNGVQLADWTLHDPIYSKPCSWPPDWAAQVVARYGSDAVEMCDGHDGSARQLHSLRDGLLGRIDQKTRLACDLLEREHWDLFSVVFADAHCAGHHLWHLGGDRAAYCDERAKPENPLRQIYVAVDQALGRVLASAGSNVRVIVFSALGMHSKNAAHDLLDEILRRFERSPTTWGKRIHGLVHAAKRLAPLRLRRKLGPLLQDRMDNALLAQDRSRRACFVEPHNDILGGIRINVVGREPHGCVEPGAAYDALCQRLERQLLSLVNLDNGQPAVKQVIYSRELYPDALPGELPDLFVEWNTDTPLVRLGAPEIGVVTRPQALHRPGDHTSNGFLLVNGPAVPPGLRGRATVADLAPTVAAWLGVTLPVSDGAPIQDLTGPPNSPHAAS